MRVFVKGRMFEVDVVVFSTAELEKCMKTAKKGDRILLDEANWSNRTIRVMTKVSE